MRWVRSTMVILAAFGWLVGGAPAGAKDSTQHSAQPDSAQPDSAQPDSAQPDSAQPDNAQPDNALRARTPILSARRVMAKVAKDRAFDALRDDVEALLKAQENRPWVTNGCISVQMGDRWVAAHRAEVPLTPASSLKTLTAYTVLTQFQPDFRFRTEVRGQRTGSAVNGPLYLVGAGDPLLETEKAPPPYNPRIAKGHPRTRLEDLADRVAKLGITKVGSVVGDGTVFDDQRTNPGWKGEFVPSEVAPLGGLVVDDGLTKAVTGSDGSPAGNAAALFADLLRARGVSVGGPSSSGKAQGGESLAFVESPTMEQIVGEMMRESDNTTAELLVKTLGRKASGQRGSTADGVAAIRTTLTNAGLDVGHLTQEDGSGLAGANKATCELLRSTMAKPGRDSPLARSLSVAGRSGTLVDRMKQTPAQDRLVAKTGTLNGTSALVGWIDAPTGSHYPPVSFAVVSNGVPQPLNRLGQFGDRLGVVLARYPRSFDPAAVAPLPPS